MRIVVCKIKGGWYLKTISSIGVKIGRKKYDTRDEALQVAESLHPDQNIEVEE